MRQNNQKTIKGICSYVCLFFFLLGQNSCSKQKKDPAEKPIQTYNDVILADNPVGFWSLEQGENKDLTSFKHNGKYIGSSGETDYDIIPGDGSAPIRIGTRDMNSFFKGAIGKFAIYDYELSSEKLLHHNNKMGE